MTRKLQQSAPGPAAAPERGLPARIMSVCRERVDLSERRGVKSENPVGIQPALHAASRRAFSLLELLVAVALLAVIIVGLLAMFSQVQRAFKSGLTQVDVMEGGRATMALITRDLRDLVAAPQTNATNFQVLWTHKVGIWPVPLALQQVGGGVRMNILQDLSFLSRSGDDWTGIAYSVSNAANGVGTLYRLTATTAPGSVTDLTSYQTFPTNVENLASYTMNVTPANVAGFEVTDPTSSPPGKTNYTHTEFHRVLDGVVNFTINAYDANGRVLDNSAGNVMNLGDFATTEYRCVNEADPSSGVITNFVLPAFIEVELAVVEPAVLSKYQSRLESGGLTAATNYLAGIVGQPRTSKAGQVHIFRQRVAIRPASTRSAPGS